MFIRQYAILCACLCRAICENLDKLMQIYSALSGFIIIFTAAAIEIDNQQRFKKNTLLS